MRALLAVLACAACVCASRLWAESDTPGIETTTVMVPTAAVAPGMHETERLVLSKFFEELGVALDTEDGSRIVAFFDNERLIEESDRASGIKREKNETYQKWTGEMREALAKDLVPMSRVLGWNRLRLTRVSPMSDRDELVVTAERVAAFNPSPVRVWLTKRSGKWQIFDSQDLRYPMRLSSNLVELRPPPGVSLAECSAERDAFYHAAVTSREAGTDKALGLLTQVRTELLPPVLAAQVYLTRAEMGEWKDRPDETLKHMDEVDARGVHAPGANSLRARIYKQKKEYDKALKYARMYFDELGCIEEAVELVASSLDGLGRKDEALGVYRAALDAVPESQQFFREFAKRAGANAGDEVVARYARVWKAGEIFEDLADDFEREKKACQLKALCTARRKILPDESLVWYYEAQALRIEERLDEAVSHLYRGFAQCEDKKVREKLMETAMDVRLGHDENGYLAAYRDAPDQRLAFEMLTRRLMIASDRRPDAWKIIRVLIKEHAQRYPRDPRLFYEEGLVLKVEGNYRKAEKVFARGLSLEPDEELERFLLNARVDCWLREGRGLIAYEKLEPKDKVFEIVAWHFSEPEYEQQLEALLLLRRRDAPTLDADQAHFQAELCWIRKDWSGVVERLATARELLADDDFRWRPRFYDFLVRSLLRLGRKDEARSEAVMSEWPLLELLTAAANGDAEEADRSFKDALDYGECDAEEILKDEDARPLRESPVFEKLRQKYREKE